MSTGREESWGFNKVSAITLLNMSSTKDRRSWSLGLGHRDVCLPHFYTLMIQEGGSSGPGKPGQLLESESPIDFARFSDYSSSTRRPTAGH